ncbi:MAG: energy transducer TonB [Bacteroidales bacterium]|nr:energy transducer TonB [Bacteroidales bacterium]
MNIPARIGFSFVPGAIVTFLLLVLMVTLIYTTNVVLDEQPARKIADIHQPEREVEERAEQQKVERPEDPETPPPEVPQVQETFDIPDNAVSMAAPSLDSALSVGLGSFASDTDYIPVYVPQPQFPRRAQTRGVSGYAVVEVIITTSGAVRDPKMIEEHPTGYGFGAAALRAAERLKYNPRVVDGVPQEVQGVLYKFSFLIE